MEKAIKNIIEKIELVLDFESDRMSDSGVTTLLQVQKELKELLKTSR